MSDCTNNLIGVRGACNASAPTSLLYLDDLPGITLERAASIADGNSDTGLDVANVSIANAIVRTKSAIVAEMLNVVQFNAITFSRLATKFVSDEYEATTLVDSGVQVELCSNCRLVELFIPSVNVRTNNAGAYNLKIVDGATTTTFAFTAIAGATTTIVTNYTPTSDKAFSKSSSDHRNDVLCCIVVPTG